MIARVPEASELSDIREMHEAMKMPYVLPDLKGMYLSIVRDDKSLVAAAGLRPMCEAFFWMNPARTERERAKGLLLLNEGCPANAEMAIAGQICKSPLDITAWVPPQVERYFAQTLSKLGWVKSPWASWSRT